MMIGMIGDDGDHDDGWLACLGCRQRNAIFEYADLRVHGRVFETFESRLVHAGDLRFAFGRRAFACKLNGVRSIFVRPMKVET